MNNWDKTKHQHTLAISAYPKGYISILNAIETLTWNADNSSFFFFWGGGDYSFSPTCRPKQYAV